MSEANKTELFETDFRINNGHLIFTNAGEASAIAAQHGLFSKKISRDDLSELFDLKAGGRPVVSMEVESMEYNVPAV